MWRLLLMLWSSATNKLMYWKHVMSVLINWMRQIINTQTHRGLMIPVSFVVHSRIFAVAQVLMWWTIFRISKETLLRCWRIGGLISRIGPLSLISWNFNIFCFYPLHCHLLLSVSASLCVFPLPLLRYAGDQTYFDEIKQFYYRDEFSHQVQEWNRQRTLAIERALNQFLYPQMAKELKSKLIAEAKESIVRVICHVICLHLFLYYIILSVLRTANSLHTAVVKLLSNIFTKSVNRQCMFD